MGKNILYLFYKITCRKHGNSILYQKVNSPYCSRCIAYIYGVNTIIETRLLANQSLHFQNVILYNYLKTRKKFSIS